MNESEFEVRNNMKWIEFIQKAREAGIKDDDELWYIDTQFDFELEFKKDPNLGWKIA